MSTRGDDAVLTDAERQAFAQLQAQVASGDRRFRLRGVQAGFQFRHGREVIASLAMRAWFGPAILLIGIAAVVAGLATTVAIAILGLVIAALGAIPIAERLRGALDKAVADRPSGGDQAV